MTMHTPATPASITEYLEGLTTRDARFTSADAGGIATITHRRTGDAVAVIISQGDGRLVVEIWGEGAANPSARIHLEGTDTAQAVAIIKAAWDAQP